MTPSELPPHSPRNNPAWLDRSLYPFTSRWFSTGSGEMHYLDEGAGNPVVFVHGNPTWSFQFRNVIAGLSSSHRCIAADHLGFGLSDSPRDFSYLPCDHATKFNALLDSLDLNKVTLVVGDWGGPIGLSWALANPERVSSVVITNTWMWSVQGNWYYEGFSRMMGGPIGRQLIRRRNFFAGNFMKRAYGDKSRLTPEIHQQYLAALPTPDERMPSWIFPREIIGSSDWLASLWDQRDTLAPLSAAIVWGMKDIAFREPELTQWQALFPSAHTVRLEDTGHFVAEEHPEVLIAEIARIAPSQDSQS